jgi:hypothetical protein
MNNQGVASKQYVTSNDALLAPFKGEDIHGGPPVVLVERPGSGLADGERYHLGVLHYFKVGAREECGRGAGRRGAAAGVLALRREHAAVSRAPCASSSLHGSRVGGGSR